MPTLTSAPAVLWALAGTLACIGLAPVGADTAVDTAAGSVVGFAAEQVGALAIAVQAATTLDSAAAARPAIEAASVVAIAAAVAATTLDSAAVVADFAAVVVAVSTAGVVGTAEVTVGAIADHDRQALILLRRVAKQSSSLPFFRVVFYRGRTTLG
ncbi:MAG: hypothetical protein WBP56_07700 [Polyangia bacterium]